jgi:hypothetical protein
LGIEASINQSVRQGNQRPSDTVLDNALSAILGAIWLDCEGQEQTTATTRRTIWGVIRNIDAALSSPPSPPAYETEKLLPSSYPPDADVDQPGIHTGEIDFLLEQGQDSIEYFAKEWFEQAIGDVNDMSKFCTDIIPESETDIMEAEGTLPGGDSIWKTHILTTSPASAGRQIVDARSIFPPQYFSTQGTSQTTDCEDVSAGDMRNDSVQTF